MMIGDIIKVDKNIVMVVKNIGGFFPEFRPYYSVAAFLQLNFLRLALYI